MNAPTFSRRQFTAGLGALVVAFSLDPKRARGQEPPRLPGSLQNNRKLDGWIRINADGTATIFSGKVELGQGILTALHQIAAEELDLPLERIKMISGDTGQTPNEGQTAGSQSVENSGTALRMAGAEVRATLIDLAAKRLGVAADQLTVADGVITASDGGKATPKARDLGDLVAALGDGPAGPRWTVEQVALVESDTRPEGAVHTVRARFALGARDPLER